MSLISEKYVVSVWQLAPLLAVVLLNVIYHHFKMKMKRITDESLSCCDELDELSSLLSLRKLLNKSFPAANHLKHVKH